MKFTMQAAMSGNLDAQKRFSGFATQPVPQEPVSVPATKTDMSGLIDNNGEINEAVFNQIMVAATEKERAKM